MCTACRAFYTPERKHRDEQPSFRSSLSTSPDAECRCSVTAQSQQGWQIEAEQKAQRVLFLHHPLPQLRPWDPCQDAGNVLNGEHRAAQQCGSCSWARTFHWRGVSSNSTDLTLYKLNSCNIWLSRIDALSWLTTAFTPSNSCLNSLHLFAAAAPGDKNVSLYSSLTHEHQSCTSEDQVRRCTGAEALCHTPEDAAENTDTLTVLLRDANWVSSITQVSHPHTVLQALADFSGRSACEVLLYQEVGNSRLLIIMKGTPLDRIMSLHVPKRIRDTMYPTGLWIWSCSVDSRKDQLKTALNSCRVSVNPQHLRKKETSY